MKLVIRGLTITIAEIEIALPEGVKPPTGNAAGQARALADAAPGSPAANHSEPDATPAGAVVVITSGVTAGETAQVFDIDESCGGLKGPDVEPGALATSPTAGVAPRHDTPMPEGLGGSAHESTGQDRMAGGARPPNDGSNGGDDDVGPNGEPGDAHGMTLPVTSPLTILADPTVIALIGDQARAHVANPPPPVEPPVELALRRPPVEEDALDIPAFLDRRERVHG